MAVVPKEATVATCWSHPVVQNDRFLFFADRFDGASDRCCALHAKCYQNATFKGKQVLNSKDCDDVLFQCLTMVYDAAPFGLQKLRFYGTVSKMKNLVAAKGAEAYRPSAHCLAPYGSGMVV